MNMLISELQMLAGDWRSWLIVVIMAAVALHSVAALWMCPVLHRREDPSAEQVGKARNNPFQIGWRFGVMMVIGIALTVTGLFMIADGIKPTLALGAMVAGVVIMQTEPQRSRIREYQARVIASFEAAPEVLEHQQARLRSENISLAITNVVLLAALVAGLLAFR